MKQFIVKFTDGLVFANGNSQEEANKAALKLNPKRKLAKVAKDKPEAKKGK